MPEIRTASGFVVLVDDADYDIVGHLKWLSTDLRRHTRYVFRTVTIDRRKTSVYMHRLLLSAPPGSQVDHINGNGLDNRRCNIRLATPSQNQAAKRNIRRNASGYRGVYKQDSSYRAGMHANGRMIWLGSFATALEAAAAYDKAAREIHGEFAVLNFRCPLTIESR